MLKSSNKTKRKGRCSNIFDIALLALLLTVSACSTTGHKRELTADEQRLVKTPLTFDLFSARGFLGGSDYERYALSDGVLWRECGNVEKKGAALARPAVEGDTVLSNNPGLILQERRLELLSDEQALALRKMAEALIERRAATQNALPAPGSVHSLSGPGLFELKLNFGGNKQHIVTSVDVIAEESTGVFRAANEFFATIRGVGPVMCNAPTFYGISRNEKASRG